MLFRLRCALFAMVTALPLNPMALASDPALNPAPVVLEGQAVAAVGLVTRIDNIAVNNSGDWRVEADTDNALTDNDSVILGPGGALLFQEGQLLVAPPGALLDSFDSISLNNNGESSFNFFLDNTAGSNDDSGVYFGATLVIQEGDISTAPTFGANTPYVGFFETKINSGNQIFVVASVDDPNVSGTVNRAFVRVDVSSSGTLLGETVLLAAGSVAPGAAPELITDMDTGPHNFAINDNGDFLLIADITGVSTQNAIVYLNQTILAREGSASPVAGRNWSTLTSSEVDLNNNGGFVFSGSLDGDAASDLLIVKNGEKFRQEGDTLADIAPFTFTSFGTGPIWISDSGDVLWYGDWNDSDTSKDTGLFLNDKLIVQEGDTIAGQTVTALRGIQEGYALSDDGRYILFEAQLGTSTDAAILIDRGPFENLVGAKPGVNGTPTLRGSGSLVPNTPISMCVANGAPNALSFLVLGLGQANVPFLGTTLVPTPTQVITGLPLDSDGGLFLSTTWPIGAPSGLQFYLQWFVADAAATFGFSSTNAIVGTTP